MAEIACQIEIDILGHPIGKQDQYAAALGGLNHFAFNPDGTVTRTQIVLSDADRRVMSSKLMFLLHGNNTERGQYSYRAESEYFRQGQNSGQLVRMKLQADSMRNRLMTKGFTKDFGMMLHKSWLYKKNLVSNITDSQISGYYDKAMEAEAE